MTRGRWILTSIGLVAADEYVRPPVQRSSLSTPQLIRDGMDATWNPMDGRTYDSRSNYYREVKARGGEIMGNESPLPKPRETIHTGDVAHDVKRAYDELT